MTFKNKWEKTEQQVQLPAALISQMVTTAYPNAHLMDYHVIAGGCANLNIRFNIENHPTMLLRVYLSNKDAAFREQKLALLLKDILPVAQIFYIGQINDYAFAITEFKQGITLRELLLGSQVHAMETLMKTVGEMLYRIHQVSFNACGFFDKDLKITPSTGQDLLNFISETLKQDNVRGQLGSSLIAQIERLFQTHRELITNDIEHNLVHGDFDPANILVDKLNNEWQISAILDWEFAFSGNTLWDIANMLRYAHEMPASFETSFLQGLTSCGFILPEDWRTRIALLNVSALLDCLARANPAAQPHICHDILALISHFVRLIEINE